MPIRVFIITEHNILLWGLQQLIKSNGSAMQLVGSAVSGGDAVAAVSAVSPDVILLDLDQHDDHAANIPDLIAESKARILMLTRQEDQLLQDKAILDGARGVLDCDASPETFLEAISKVNQGEIWLGRAATGRIFLAMSRRKAAETATNKT